MAVALSDDDIVPTYREETTDDDGDIINPTKKMRASGLSYEKVKVFSDGKCAEEEAVKYNNFKNYAASHWKLKIFHWDKKEKEVVLLKLKKH
jgi:hypothetical protein